MCLSMKSMNYSKVRKYIKGLPWLYIDQLLTSNKLFNISETQFVIYTKHNNNYLMELLEGLKLLPGEHLASPLFKYL